MLLCRRAEKAEVANCGRRYGIRDGQREEEHELRAGDGRRFAAAGGVRVRGRAVAVEENLQLPGAHGGAGVHAVLRVVERELEREPAARTPRLRPALCLRQPRMSGSGKSIFIFKQSRKFKVIVKF